MGDKSKIEWTDATWNPVTGCSKVSAGCKNCYAERVFHRVYGRELTDCVDSEGEPDMRQREFTDVVCHPERLDVPLHWKRPRRIFVNSMSDLFHERVPLEFIKDIFEVIQEAHWHTFQILTKRPTRMKLAMGVSGKNWRSPLRNVWLGVSVEDQKSADRRVPLLLDTPAAVRFVSYEPALGPVDLTAIAFGTFFNAELGRMEPSRHNLIIPITIFGDEGDYNLPGLDWVIAGGESGPNARPSHPDWFRGVRDECQEAGIPFFFKQWGEWGDFDAANQCWSKITEKHEWPLPDDVGSYRIGKKRAGRLLDGREWNEFPEVRNAE